MHIDQDVEWISHLFGLQIIWKMSNGVFSTNRNEVDYILCITKE